MTCEFVFWLMIATGVASLLYPWHPTWPKAKWLVHLPLVMVPLWAWYELLLPAEMNIRLDLLLIFGGLGLLGVVYIVRLVAFRVIFRANDTN